VGPAPKFPHGIEKGIDEYLAMRALEVRGEEPPSPAADDDGASAPPRAVFEAIEAILECSV
jgi:hypothetical protein